MTTGKALGITFVVVVLVGAYLALAAALGIKEYWAGFLFLTQWGLMEQIRVDRLPVSIGGAIVGAAVALFPAVLPPLIGATPALVVTLIAALLSIYLLVTQMVPLLFNAATAVFLTVVSIPEVMQGAAPIGIFIGLAAGIVFFGGLALAAAAVGKARAPRTAAAPQ